MGCNSGTKRLIACQSNDWGCTWHDGPLTRRFFWHSITNFLQGTDESTWLWNAGPRGPPHLYMYFQTASFWDFPCKFVWFFQHFGFVLLFLCFGWAFLLWFSLPFLDAHCIEAIFFSLRSHSWNIFLYFEDKCVTFFDIPTMFVRVRRPPTVFLVTLRDVALVLQWLNPGDQWCFRILFKESVCVAVVNACLICLMLK